MFLTNDYLQVLDTYYYPFLKKGRSRCDLSGWEHSPLGASLPFRMKLPKNEDLKRYYADSGMRLQDFKKDFLPLVDAIIARPAHFDEFTMLPSTTIAISIVLACLKENGVEKCLIEAPTYFAVLEHAPRLGIKCELLAPLMNDNGEPIGIDIDKVALFFQNEKSCLWLHQPRYSIGSDQNCKDITDIYSLAKEKNFIVLDEANHDNPEEHIQTDLSANIFRIRSLIKPLGLNGLNLAYLVHPAKFREEIVDAMWSIGGTLDWFSLENMRCTLSPSVLYTSLLHQTRSQLQARRNTIRRFLAGTEVELLGGETGSLGCLRFAYKNAASPRKRKKILTFFAEHQIPAMLGNHFSMPYVSDFEYIRVNLFNSDQSLFEPLSSLSAFVSSSVS